MCLSSGQPLLNDGGRPGATGGVEEGFARLTVAALGPETERVELSKPTSLDRE